MGYSQHEVLALGDGDNDKEMLGWAGGEYSNFIILAMFHLNINIYIYIYIFILPLITTIKLALPWGMPWSLLV